MLSNKMWKLSVFLAVGVIVVNHIDATGHSKHDAHQSRQPQKNATQSNHTTVPASASDNKTENHAATREAFSCILLRSFAYGLERSLDEYTTAIYAANVSANYSANHSAISESGFARAIQDLDIPTHLRGYCPDPKPDAKEEKAAAEEHNNHKVKRHQTKEKVVEVVKPPAQNTTVNTTKVEKESVTLQREVASKKQGSDRPMLEMMLQNFEELTNALRLQLANNKDSKSSSGNPTLVKHEKSQNSAPVVTKEEPDEIDKSLNNLIRTIDHELNAKSKTKSKHGRNHVHNHYKHGYDLSATKQKDVQEVKDRYLRSPLKDVDLKKLYDETNNKAKPMDESITQMQMKNKKSKRSVNEKYSPKVIYDPRIEKKFKNHKAIHKKMRNGAKKSQNHS